MTTSGARVVLDTGGTGAGKTTTHARAGWSHYVGRAGVRGPIGWMRGRGGK